MHYIIMADGKGTRWKDYQGIPKHFVEIDGKKIITRTIDLLVKFDPKCRITVTSHDSRYEFENAVRYEPKDNHLEIDRFTEELIDDEVCFLYGDTYYTEECLMRIVNEDLGDITFFGNRHIIVGIKVKRSDVFRKHIHRIKFMYLNGNIQQCKGWQVYQSYLGIEVGNEKKIGKFFINIDEDTFDINTPEDYIEKVKFK